MLFLDASNSLILIKVIFLLQEYKYNVVSEQGTRLDMKRQKDQAFINKIANTSASIYITPKNLGPLTVCAIHAHKSHWIAWTGLFIHLIMVFFSHFQMDIPKFFQDAKNSIGGNMLVRYLTNLSYCDIRLLLYQEMNEFLITLSQGLWPSGAGITGSRSRYLVFFNGGIYR